MASIGGGCSGAPLFFTPLLRTLLLVLVAVAGHAAAASGGLEQKCASEVGTKLLDCLAFAQGQADAPSRKCCGSASDIRAADPACLCYVIQQTYEGKPSFKGLGLQLARLVQLPTVCNIPNSNITDCPRLLGVKPSSPDYAAFNTSASSSSSSKPMSAGVVNQVQYTYAMASAIASAIVFSVFSP